MRCVPDGEDVDPGILLRPRTGSDHLGVIKGALAQIVHNQPTPSHGFDQLVGYVSVQHQVRVEDGAGQQRCLELAIHLRTHLPCSRAASRRAATGWTSCSTNRRCAGGSASVSGQDLADQARHYLNHSMFLSLADSVCFDTGRRFS